MAALRDVRPGMRVIDSLGQEVGTVDQVSPGDRGPVTTRGRGGVPQGLAQALRSTANVHPQTASRMLRRGYVRIGRRGAGPHGYASADQIVEVGDDVVQLGVSRDELLRG